MVKKIAFPCLFSTLGLFSTPNEGVRRDHSSPFRGQAVLQLPSIGPRRRGGGGGFLAPFTLPALIFCIRYIVRVGWNLNAALLSSLQGSPGFECVQPTSHTDVNTKMKKSSCRIVYDFPSIPWLDDPPVTKERIAPNQQDDSFGVWQSSTRRSATDRYVRVVLNLLALLRYVLMLNTRSI